MTSYLEVRMYQPTGLHAPEDVNLRQHNGKSLKSYMLCALTFSWLFTNAKCRSQTVSNIKFWQTISVLSWNLRTHTNAYVQ